MKFLEKISLEIVGSILYAIGIGYFVNSSHIAPGGVSGIAVMINYLSGFPIGTATLLINMPIVICGWFLLPRSMITRTLRIILISSVFLDIAGAIPPYPGDRLLGAVFGGLLTGAGIGIIFYSGATTGGVDILSYIVRKRFPDIRIGLAMLIIDSVIIAASMAVFRELEAGLFGIICLYCTTKVIDTIIYGGEGGSLVMIISEKSQKISDYIMNRAGRGVTLVDCKGGYSDKTYSLIMCAVRKRELTKLRIAVRDIDEKAFVICVRSNNIYGEGFETENE